jgi:hypothetical protein
MSQSGSFFNGTSPAGSVLTLTGNTGGAVSPILGNINVVGAGLITVTGDPLTHTLTITSSGSTADQFDGDTGSAIPVGGILNIVGSANIHTAASGNTVEVILDDDVSISGSFTAGTTLGFITSVTGDITASAGNFNLPTTLSTADEGVITINSLPFIQNFAGNVFIGTSAGNFTLTPGVAIENTVVGNSALNAVTTGNNNTVFGFDAMLSATTASNNTAFGSDSLVGITTGSNNVSIGTSSGNALLTSESNNILIGSTGVVGDNNTIRIGSSGSGAFQQNTAYFGGIYGTGTLNTAYVVTVDSTDKLGSIALSGFADQFDGDTGTAVPNDGLIIISGGSNINTVAMTNIVTVNLDDTVSISGSFTAGTTAGFITSQTGDITATAGNIVIPFANSTGTEGIIKSGSGTKNLIYATNTGNIFLNDAGTLTFTTAFDNIGIGFASLNSLTTGGVNTCIGVSAGQGITSGNENVCIGPQAGQFIDSGSNNVCIGEQSGRIMQFGINNISIGQSSLVNFMGPNTGQNDSNIAIGFESLRQMASGVYNTCLGNGSGSNYTTTENNNLILGCQNGTIAENNVIRIGNIASGAYPAVVTSTSCFIQGIAGNTVSNTQLVTIDPTTGQLGVTSTSGSTWQVVTGATNLVKGNGYFVNGASTVNFTLPTTTAVGDTFEIAVLDTAVGGWQINQNASQYIIGNSSAATTPQVTTVGTGGNVATTVSINWQFAKVICAIANTAFVIQCATGGALTFT